MAQKQDPQHKSQSANIMDNVHRSQITATFPKTYIQYNSFNLVPYGNDKNLGPKGPSREVKMSEPQPTQGFPTGAYRP